MGERDFDTDNLPLLLKVIEVAEVLRRGRTETYALIRSGEIPSVKIGRARLIRRDDLKQFIANLPTDPSPSSAYKPPATPHKKAAKAATPRKRAAKAA